MPAPFKSHERKMYLPFKKHEKSIVPHKPTRLNVPVNNSHKIMPSFDGYSRAAARFFASSSCL